MHIYSAIKKACLIVGGQASLAELIGVSPSVVNQWIMGRRPIPAERCIGIEKVTGGYVRCEDLRPDVGWSYLRGTDPIVTVDGYEDNGNKRSKLP